jgi:acetyltransferase-like isoleucine patch superfamily enzyme
LANWLTQKFKNQVTKLHLLLYRRKVARFKMTLKYCGSGTSIRFPVCFEGPGHITIGSNVSINAFVHMWGHGGIIIGNDCLIASHASINSVTHDTAALLYRETIIEKKVTIGNNVWIGSHAVILPGITIGDNAIIGAGAVVTKDIPANKVAAGVPAKIIRDR